MTKLEMELYLALKDLYEAEPICDDGDIRLESARHWAKKALTSVEERAINA